MVSSPQADGDVLALNKENLDRHVNGGIDRIAGRLLDRHFSPENASSASATPSVSSKAKTSESSIECVEIRKTKDYGFGFNIIGGKDSPHIPDDMGIFVSMIRPGGPVDGILHEGDKILAVDETELTNLSHDEAVKVFREVANNAVAKIHVDKHAETRIMRELKPSSFSFPRILNQSEGGSAKMDKTQREVSEGPPPGFRSVLSPYGKVNIPQDEDGEESVTSYAPSMHSIIDDVPRTPKKPYSLLDPRNNSLFTEVLYVSVGVAAIALGSFAAYKFIKGRRT
ncbi:hypothetical protein WR25_15921 [Diploscapter pachys]|uniref:PDZ domain-containing protein n=1 Tax=Diploscapter pachys TaxID=2018661 RepID=A0A2A2JMT7_9BILA|nr:hypothetical protein WR25_15921 [Diploscapter pachys]